MRSAAIALSLALCLAPVPAWAEDGDAADEGDEGVELALEWAGSEIATALFISRAFAGYLVPLRSTSGAEAMGLGTTPTSSPLVEIAEAWLLGVEATMRMDVPVEDEASDHAAMKVAARSAVDDGAAALARWHEPRSFQAPGPLVLAKARFDIE